jgi:hypothetical protein
LLRADGQQLDRGQADGVGLGVHQVVAWGEVVAGQGLVDAVGEAVGPAVPAGASEGDQLLVAGGGELVAGGPALQQAQECGRAQVVAGDRQRRREGRKQVLAQPVAQATLVAGGPVVVAGDRAQLPGQLAMRDQGPQACVAVQGEQAADAGVGGVVLLARRAAAAGDQVGVDRQDHIAGIDQPFDQQPVTGLDDHPDLGRVGFQDGDPLQQPVDRSRAVLHPADLEHAVLGASQGDEVEVLGPVDPNPKHPASLRRGQAPWRRGAVLMDQSSQDDTLVGVGPPGPAPWDAVSPQSSRDKRRKRSQGATP